MLAQSVMCGHGICISGEEGVLHTVHVLLKDHYNKLIPVTVCVFTTICIVATFIISKAKPFWPQPFWQFTLYLICPTIYNGQVTKLSAHTHSVTNPKLHMCLAANTL